MAVDPGSEVDTDSSIRKTGIKEVVVEYRGSPFKYKVSKELNIEGFGKSLEEDTGVAVAQQKLFGQGGKLLKYEGTESASLLPGKLKLLGSTKNEIQKVVESNEKFNNKIRVKDDLNVRRRRRRKPEGRRRELPEYRFERIQTLQGLPDQEKAREILTRLSEETGFLAVLKKNRWKVGLLSEMYPEGQVGISEVCVLGVNKNKGQEISLRIRTDDLKGFRKYLSMKEVLCHELAHMVHSEHDANFYMLMREIQKDIIDLDWKQQSGIRLGGSNGPVYHSPIEYEDEDEGPTSFVVGGTEKFGRGLSAKEKAKLAAQERIGKAKKGVKDSDTKKTPPPSDVYDDTKTEEQIYDIDMEIEEENSVTNDKECIEKPVNDDNLRESSNCWIYELPHPSNEDQAEISRSLEMLCSRNSADTAVVALETMMKYTENIINQPENKIYRKINLSNSSFHAKVLKALSGLLVMRAIGWKNNQVENILEFPDDNDALALLVHAKKEMENCITLMKCVN
uniref:WLM domain-containing protein n=1 Tax=Aplanochytrium stocchinoi TaxID=215587 RepID=A0A7S3LHK3_9STRA|mmetsp:Transcript_13799/g.17108  ORF Transcript_13799/g.17108 Transcript_13799/m.17108 type:complete len:508 (+) Transcript_13799:245-1768(+)